MCENIYDIFLKRNIQHNVLLLPYCRNGLYFYEYLRKKIISKCENNSIVIHILQVYKDH